MICIDFQGGAHGNFLEFVCNKFIGQVQTGSDSPFNKYGAAHSKNYINGDKLFVADHFSFGGHNAMLLQESNRVVSIQIAYDDLLPLSQISILRAGDRGIDNNQLEINTYNKLNNYAYRWVLDNLLDSFFKDQVKESYNAVKDESWPDIENIRDFQRLPENIQDECLRIHKIKLHDLSENNPNCDRTILREFFKFSFKFPEQSGFITQQQKMIYSNETAVYVFPFGAFYDTNQFVRHLNEISKWVGMPLTDHDALVKLHNEFLNRQPYKDSKYMCDKILEKIYIGQNVDLSELNLMEESYILAQIELKYGVEILDWFDDPLDLYDYIYERRH